MTAIREWFLSVGFEKTPDVEVLDPVLAVQEVQGGPLAERNSEQSVSVEMRCIRISAKERFQISQGNIAKSAQVTPGDRLHGSFFAGHTGKYSGRFGLGLPRGTTRRSTCGLLVCCLEQLIEKARGYGALLPHGYLE